MESALLSRRVLLAGLGAGAVGAAGALTGTAPVLSLGSAGGTSSREASWWDRTFLSLQAAGLAEWSRVVGETFTLNGSHRLRVVAATAFARSGARPAGLGRSQAFSVVFEPIAGPPLPATDKVYKLVHPSYPPLPIYMSAPVGLGRATRLIAVFN
jgi:hypothetical protein